MTRQCSLLLQWFMVVPLVLLSSVVLVSGQDTNGTDPTADATIVPAEQWGGCVDPNNPGQLVTIGKRTTICLTLANGMDWSTDLTYLRLSFNPLADEYSRFHIPSSFDQLVGGTLSDEAFKTRNITLHVSSQQKISYQRKYYDGFSKVYPFLTAILDVKNGVVDGIAWDDGCLFCKKNQCLENTFDFTGLKGNEKEFRQKTQGCFITSDLCTPENEDGTGKNICDLQLYVVWTGTDSNGLALQSSNYRFSAFPVQELADRFSSLVPDVPEVNIPFVGDDEE